MRLRVGLRRERAAACVGLVLAAATPACLTASAQAGVARRTTACASSPVWRTLGPTYVERLAVSGTTCAGGQTVIKAYNRCRVTVGGVRGHCRMMVDGLSCTERRQSSPDEFIAVVSCTKPREVVDFTYTEFSS